ncbi:MAG TPA: ABC transporter permease [Xanthobacteraceae bacterium]|nr:ABC transporter permease [Xanthobacteraceae bacterium]
MQRVLWLGISFGFAALLVLIWKFIASLELLSPLFFPAPDVAWAALVDGIKNGDLLKNALTSLSRMLVGWLSASLLGVLLGGLIASSSLVRTYCVPLLEYFRQIPSSAKLPIAIMILGITNEMIVVIIAIGAVWPVLLSTIQGFTSVEPRLIDAARNLELNRFEMFWKISLPAALPDIFAGLRIGLTISLILTVVSEMLTGLGGIGEHLLLSANYYRGPELYAGIFILSMIGFTCNFLLASAGRKLLRR